MFLWNICWYDRECRILFLPKSFRSLCSKIKHIFLFDLSRGNCSAVGAILRKMMNLFDKSNVQYPPQMLFESSKITYHFELNDLPFHLCLHKHETSEQFSNVFLNGSCGKYWEFLKIFVVMVETLESIFSYFMILYTLQQQFWEVPNFFSH